MKKNKIFLLTLFILTVVGFFYRFKGLGVSYSFWIDETSSAAFARSILERGVPILPTGYAANDYSLHFYLMAFSFKLLGLSEFAARLPSVIFGSLTIPVVYFLTSRFADKRVGLFAAILTTFSVLEIVYSRQARSYQELQFFSLLAIAFFIILLDSLQNSVFKLRYLLAFLITFCLSFLVHKFALLFLIELFIYFVFFQRKLMLKLLLGLFISFKNRKRILGQFLILILFSFFIFFLLRFTPFLKAIQETTFDFWRTKFDLSIHEYLKISLDHIKYYHSFLWRQYPHLSLLSFLGVVVAFTKKNKYLTLVLTVIACHFLFVVFGVFAAFVRYMYLIFPLFFLLSSYFLVWVADNLFSTEQKKWKYFFLFVVLLFILLNGNKFSLIPKNFYSLNADMSEIPEPDFKSTYQIIKDKAKGIEDFVVIDNHTDSSEWYLGDSKPDYYLVGSNELEPIWNLAHGKAVDPVSGATYLVDLNSFKQIQESNSVGFVVLDERAIEYMNLDRGLIDYIKQSLKRESRKEYIINNSLSIWPIELYSWGL